MRAVAIISVLAVLCGAVTAALFRQTYPTVEIDRGWILLFAFVGIVLGSVLYALLPDRLAKGTKSGGSQ